MSYTYDVISENESEADIRLPQEGYDSYLLKSHSKTTEAKFAFVNDNFLYVFYTPGESAEVGGFLDDNIEI